MKMNIVVTVDLKAEATAFAKVVETLAELGVAYEMTPDSVAVEAPVAEPQPKAEKPKAEKPKASKGGKGKTEPKVLRVDKNGLQWIAEYDEKQYKAKSLELYGTEKPKASNRPNVYRALGWIL